MKDLVGLVERTVSGLGFELVDFEASPRARLLRVFIDCRERPVNVDDCERVSHQLTHVFEVEHVDYDRLEVSSPGLDRPLKKVADFERFVGHPVAIRLRLALAAAAAGEKAGGRRNFTGTLLSCDGVRIRVATADGEREFALADIDRARLVPTFETSRE